MIAVEEEGSKVHMILCYPTGRRVDSLLLATSGTSMRLAIRSRNETIELNLEEGQWRSEDGSHVEIESVVWDGQTAIPHPVLLTRTAGS